MARTNYAGHDAKYRELKAAGAPGWASEDDYRAFETEFAWGLAGLEPFAGKRVLELGCGAGNMVRWFVERGCAYTGVDISPAAIAWAKERAGAGARLTVGNIVEGIGGEYDLVVDGHCLHCIIGDDRARLLANVRAALVPGGHFFVSTMCGEVTLPALRACFDPVTRCQVVDGVAYRFIGDAEGILEELRVAKLEVVRSLIHPRTGPDDQDHLWALAVRADAASP